ncbi:MAG: hypothetical protein WBX95_17220 [Xanthobacteraceae bacterium]|jgi:hypothetical protein
MPIFMEVEKTEAEITRERESGKPHPDQYLPVPDFTYSSDCLAQMIVDAWTDQSFQDKLLHRDAHHRPTPAAVKLATESVNSCGFNVERAVVISEKEYYAGYTIPIASPEIVFVLPNPNRVRLHPSGHPLLETAKLLMATTPNGI